MGDLTAKIGESHAQVMQSNQQLLQKISEPPQAPVVKDAPPTLDDAELEGMSRKDFLGIIGDMVGRKLETALDEKVGTKLSTLTDQTSKLSITNEVQTAQAKFPDFKDWVTEVGALKQQFPEMEVEGLYHLARGQNPEKVTELADAITTAQAEADAAKEPNAPFGGFSSSATPGAVNNDAMGDSESAEAAWAEAVEHVGESNLNQMLSDPPDILSTPKGAD